MNAESAVSVLVSRTLDDLGYSQQMVKCRQDFYKYLCSFDRDVNIAGSKAEGLTSSMESDIDIMTTAPHIVCSSIPLSQYYKQRWTVFQMERTNTAPGYTRLIYDKTNQRKYVSKPLHASLTEPIVGNIYLSSDSWREEHKKILATFLTRSRHIRIYSSHGPSNPSSGLSLDADDVMAIFCYCPDLLQSWLNRPRRHGWPSDDLFHEISSLEAHVVPIGFKESCFQFLEWRICFTKAETKLVQNLNDCQTKLYILLKLVARSSLKPVCQDITTYVMKNITLWMAELLPAYYFTEENLAQALQTALRFLRKCLVDRFLPSYMIPERNLLTNALLSRGSSRMPVRVRLITMLDILLAEGSRIFFRCQNIRNAWSCMYACPQNYKGLCYIRNACEVIAYYLSQNLQLPISKQLLESFVYQIQHKETDWFEKLFNYFARAYFFERR